MTETAAREPEGLWTVAEVAAFLKVSEGHVYRMKARNEIPFVYAAGVRFIPDQIRQWVHDKSIPAVK